MLQANSTTISIRAKANAGDKGYSLTDCFSMSVMRERGMDEILTADHHFEQEGLIALLRVGA
jgi:predicted nucleic acid-binding protein